MANRNQLRMKSLREPLRKYRAAGRSDLDPAQQEITRRMQFGALGNLTRAEKAYLSGTDPLRGYDVIRRVRRKNKLRGIDTSKFR